LFYIDLAGTLFLWFVTDLQQVGTFLLFYIDLAGTLFLWFVTDLQQVGTFL
jgi:hypothetical protein